MKTSTFQIIRPEEGHFLTQKEVSENTDRIFSEEIYLSANDSIDNYIEIDAEQKERMEAEQEQRMRARMNETEKEADE